MKLRTCGSALSCLAAFLLFATTGFAQINPWNVRTHGACCEGNLAAWGNNTYVLAPVLDLGNKIFRSTDGGRTWLKVYPPVDVSVPFGIEGDLTAWQPPGASDIAVNYFGTQLADGSAAVSTDAGDTWTVVNIPVAFPANDQAWIYPGRLQAPGCGAAQTAPYVLAGWYRIGSVALFSCDGGLTWPFETPLVGLDGEGPEHVACQQTAHAPTADSDTRIALESFDKMKAHRHGGWGTDGKFYWTEVAGSSLFICKTNDLGVTWAGVRHPLATGTASPTNICTSMAFDENGTAYVLHTNKLYVSFNQGEAIRFVHTLPRWGDDASVADVTGQAFCIDGGTIHIALKQANHQVWYLRGNGVDTASPTWTQELVRAGSSERLDFIQIVLDGRGVPTIGYTAAGSEDTQTSSRDLDPIAVDDAADAFRGQPEVIAVLANDHDPDDATLTVTQVSDPPNGKATINPNGTITYVSEASFLGTDTFTYTIADPIGLTDVATVTVVVTSQLGVDPGSLSFRLGPITPNPFQTGATIGFEVATSGVVSLELFAPTGRRVATLHEAVVEPGRHQVTWSGIDASGRSLPAGLYFVRLTAEGRSLTGRLLRVR
jgi:Big-like domain-containing protein/flagellar hook capping protein FlgD